MVRYIDIIICTGCSTSTSFKIIIISPKHHYELKNLAKPKTLKQTNKVIAQSNETYFDKITKIMYIDK